MYYFDFCKSFAFYQKTDTTISISFLYLHNSCIFTSNHNKTTTAERPRDTSWIARGSCSVRLIIAADLLEENTLRIQIGAGGGRRRRTGEVSVGTGEESAWGMAGGGGRKGSSSAGQGSGRRGGM
jgi:hypothetical protein